MGLSFAYRRTGKQGNRQSFLGPPFFYLFIITGLFAVSPMGPEAVIEADVAAQAAHNQAAFLSIRTTKPGPPENRIDLAIIMKRFPQNNILQNIIEARLVGIESIPLSLAATLTRIDMYLDLYKEVRAYYVAIEYALKEETRYFYNGVNYRLYILGLEEGQWVIVEASEIPVYRMIEEGYGFGTPEEKTALWIQEMKERTGKFINPKGETIGEENCSASENKGE